MVGKGSRWIPSRFVKATIGSPFCSSSHLATVPIVETCKYRLVALVTAEKSDALSLKAPRSSKGAARDRTARKWYIKCQVNRQRGAVRRRRDESTIGGLFAALHFLFPFFDRTDSRGPAIHSPKNPAMPSQTHQTSCATPARWCARALGQLA